MKIACQSCAAKYSIADEKVIGKVVKIKCKRCGATIVVNGNDPATLAQLQQQAAAPAPSSAHAGGGDDDDEGGATRVATADPAALQAMLAQTAASWTVSVSDDDQRTMSTNELVDAVVRGAIHPECYAWRDGMANWQSIQQIPELSSAIAAKGPAPAAFAPAVASAPAVSAPSYESAGPQAPGYGMAASPQPDPYQAPAATVPTAQVSSPGRVDLFGAAAPGTPSAPLASHAPSVAPSPVGADKSIGQRNENSVLFSLKDILAAEARSSAAPPPSASNDRIDDIFGMGSGGAPLLTAPSLTAPVVEAPPPPPPPVAVAMPSMPMPMPTQEPAKRSPVPFIVGGVGLLALVAAVAVVVVGGKSDEKTASTAASTSKEAEKAPDSSKDSNLTAPVDAAPTSKPVADTPPASDKPSDEKPSDADAKTADTKAADSKSTDPKATTSKGTTAVAAKEDPKKADPKKEEPKKEEPKKEEPKASGGGGEFDRGAAMAALGSAAGAAKGCKKPDGPTGSTKVQVTFAPSGRATTAVVGAPFGGTPVGSCIASAFKGASVPPFSGAPVTVSKTVSIK